MWIIATHPLVQRLAVTMSGIIAVLGVHSARAGALYPLFALVHRHLVHLVLRLDRLAQRWQAGGLPAPRPSRAANTRSNAAPSAAPAATRPLRLPDCPSWLIRLVQPTAQFSGQVMAIIDDPQTRALFAAAPQAGRILRPLCRMLGLPQPDWLRRPGYKPEPTSPRRLNARPPRPFLARYRAALAPQDPPHPAGPDFRASHVFRT